MARGNGTAEAPATDGTATSEGDNKRSRASRSYIVIPLPAELKERFETEAKAADKPVGPYVRDILAGFLGIEIPATVSTRRSKYSSDDERKAAQDERTKSRSQTLKNLMKAFRDIQAKGVSPEEAARLASVAVLTGTPPTDGQPEDQAKGTEAELAPVPEGAVA